MPGCESEGFVTAESVLFLFSFSLPLCRPSCFRLLESPHIVLLRAGAFRQGDVVHSHLAAAASPTLSLQDHLVNSKQVFLFECFAIETAAVIFFFLYIKKQTRLLCGKKKLCMTYRSNHDKLTLSRPVPHNVIWVCLQPFPPVRPHTAGLYCFPFFTNTCSMPTWWPASLCRNDRQRLPSFQGGVRGRTSRAPRPVRLLPTSGIVR